MKKLFSLLSFILFPSSIFAEGKAVDWQLSFQEPASPLMAELVNFHSLVFWIITVITVFVFFYWLMFVGNLAPKETKSRVRQHITQY